MAAFRDLFTTTASGRRLSPKGRAASVLALVMAFGLSLGALNVPLASSAAHQIDVLHLADAAAPIDPRSELWERAAELEVPLSAQQMQQPGGGTTRTVRVRAVEDGLSFAIRMSWEDPTRDDGQGLVPTDAAAIQLPIDPAVLPYQCMGQTNSRVNIWQWKASLEVTDRSAIGALAEEGAGVRNLTSNGICKAVDSPGLAPRVRSFHDGQMWHVVFARGIGKGNLTSAPIEPTLNTSAAFAVWNGTQGEVRGMKAVSTWNTMAFTAPEKSNAGDLIALGAVVLLSAAAVAFTMRRMAGS
ncbi:MAG TPA: ethylbenzene dehydrogenase-related protein [Chloroflexia bacterium]|nr:ethylbenzene dehydrogenase-related protein [Chloroflexia bacterium]